MTFEAGLKQGNYGQDNKVFLIVQKPSIANSLNT